MVPKTHLLSPTGMGTGSTVNYGTWCEFIVFQDEIHLFWKVKGAVWLVVLSIVVHGARL